MLRRLHRVALPLLLIHAGARATAAAQEAAQDAEREAVRKVVETYLFTEEVDEKEETFADGARIVFTDHGGKRTRVEAVGRRKGGGGRGKVGRGVQRIVAIDVVNDGASVKVETVLFPDTPSALKHWQYLWLLKTDAGWKIAGILMPGFAPPGDAAGEGGAPRRDAPPPEK